MTSVFANVQENAGKIDEMKHPFFLKAKDMLDAGDHAQQVKDKLALKLLRLSNGGRDGFIMTDFPRNLLEAEMMEE